ncbi:hypothetical protein B0I35DRAFT_430466 [Stachybotrys elegans]|uniref:Uncharacterized protein n=1 Tax=Stachybotrys elegans TaxID=80388 RepID=A0A8K0WRD9_9HYPO|nr:hypothetical protein B0I35DRAFT_430466 [Stachybotrys elegans]
MASPTKPQMGRDVPKTQEIRGAALTNGDAARAEAGKRLHSDTKTPEPRPDQQTAVANTPSTPGTLAPFDWSDFEARYERALLEADEQEKNILREAEGLAKYFQTWASAASSHDDERAIKRLQTQQRYVNLSEEKTAQKQQHYEEVVRAFESALALLRSR